MSFIVVFVVVHLANFQQQQLAPSVGNIERKAMAPSRKVVSTAESSKVHSLQEQVSKMMAMVEAFT